MTLREKVFAGILCALVVGGLLGQGRQGVPASLEAALYVAVAGDTMTGNLVVPSAILGTHAINLNQGNSNYVETAGDTMLGALVMPDGAVGTPSISGSDADSGIYFTSSGKFINVGVDGANALTVTASDVRFLAGSTTTPSIVVSDSDTGFAYSAKGKALLVIVDGVIRAQIDSTGIVVDTGITCNGVGDFSGGTFIPPTHTIDVHLVVEGASKGKSANPPSEDLHGVWFVFEFDRNADEELFLTWEVPENYSNGTDITLSFVWVPTTTGTKTVTWGLEHEFRRTENGEILDSGTTTQIVTDDAVGSVNALQETSDITLSGTSVLRGDMLGIRPFRDADASEAGADDDYNADAGLVELHLHYTADSL